jgi:ureidoglycolate hydrolase
MIDEKELQIKEFRGIGYLPLIDYGTWRVAYLRYIDELIPRNIKRVERHRETDEVFVLLEGKVVLFMGSGDDQVEDLQPVVLEPYKLYNVKKNAWHCCVLSHDATILLVENRDTGLSNTDYCALDDDLCKVIIDTSFREQPGEWENV